MTVSVTVSVTVGAGSGASASAVSVTVTVGRGAALVSAGLLDGVRRAAAAPMPTPTNRGDQRDRPVRQPPSAAAGGLSEPVGVPRPKGAGALGTVVVGRRGRLVEGHGVLRFGVRGGVAGGDVGRRACAGVQKPRIYRPVSVAG
ncbi:hypothetical protein GCM10023238_03120 [Streptomyces heliomycini]